jgi:hypothetical protein
MESSSFNGELLSLCAEKSRTLFPHRNTLLSLSCTYTCMYRYTWLQVYTDAYRHVLYVYREHRYASLFHMYIATSFIHTCIHVYVNVYIRIATLPSLSCTYTCIDTCSYKFIGTCIDMCIRVYRACTHVYCTCK